MKLLAGSGGLVLTISDYMRFSQIMLNDGVLDGIRILSHKTVELMTTNHFPETIFPFRVGAIVTKWYGFRLGIGTLMNVAESELLGAAGLVRLGWFGQYVFLGGP